MFADPPGAEPLAARLERERLREMFFGEILPKRNVEVDVLCHGVTRVRLQDRITARAGYHVVHWSGHGDVNALALVRAGVKQVAAMRWAVGDVYARRLSGKSAASRSARPMRTRHEMGVVSATITLIGP